MRTGFGRAVLEGQLQAWPHRHPLCLQKWILTSSQKAPHWWQMSCRWLPKCFGGTVRVEVRPEAWQVSASGQCSISHHSCVGALGPELCWGSGTGCSLPGHAPCPWCRRAFPSAQWLMTQRDTGWQEPWCVYRGTVSLDMGTVHLLWSGAALVMCTAEAWPLNQTHFLITASFSSFLLLPLDTWVHPV